MSTETTTDTSSLDIGAAGRQLTDLVVANPVPSVLAAAATGAGLMALVALMARPNARLPSLSELQSMAKDAAPSSVDTPDVGSVRSQLADLLERVSSSLPTKSDAKQTLTGVGDSARDSALSAWDAVRDQAASVLDTVQPQLKSATTAATKVARENPLWSAVAAAVVGTLIGAQFLGKLYDR